MGSSGVHAYELAVRELPEPTAGPLPLATTALGRPVGWVFTRPSCICPATRGVFLLLPPRSPHGPVWQEVATWHF